MSVHPGVTGRKINALPESLEFERFLTARQAAELLGISVSTFRRQYWAGTIPTPIQLSTRRLGWRVRDLITHLSKKKEMTS